MPRAAHSRMPPITLAYLLVLALQTQLSFADEVAPTFFTRWGSYGSTPQQLDDPLGMAQDSHGHIYVVDSGNRRIIHLTAAGQFVNDWSCGYHNGQPLQPRSIACDKTTNTLFVGFSYFSEPTPQVRKYTTNGTFLGSFGANAELLAISPFGTLWICSGVWGAYVANTSFAGDTITYWQAPQSGYYRWISGMAIDAVGHVILRHKHNVMYKMLPHGGSPLITAPADQGRGGDGGGVALDASGRIYTCDWTYNNIDVLDSNLQWLTSWSASSSGEGSLLNPMSIVVDDSCNIYVGQGHDPSQWDITRDDCIKRYRLDRDADGLCDSWETDGLRAADGGANYQLEWPPGNRANRDHKDVFLEIDAMSGCAPHQQAINSVVNSFSLAWPLSPPNPDGQPGVTLHAKIDDTAIPRVPLPPYFWRGVFDPIKAQWFGNSAERARPAVLPLKQKAFRYCLFADTVAPNRSGKRLLGKSKNIGCMDMMVALGQMTYDGYSIVRGGTANQQANTLMHELGHALGLRHGGADDDNYKPHYRSVMNYIWTGPYANTEKYWRLSYSMADQGTLTESCLNELAGLGGLPGDSVFIPWTGFHPTRRTKSLRLVDEAAFLDWNRSGSLSACASQQYVDWRSSVSVLRSFQDWPLVRLPPTLSDTLSGASEDEEVSYEDADRVAGVFCDCNENGQADYRDLLLGAAHDLDENGVPDECDYARVTFGSGTIVTCPGGDGDSLVVLANLWGLCAFDTALTQEPLKASLVSVTGGPVRLWAEDGTPLSAVPGLLNSERVARFAHAKISGCGRVRVRISAGDTVLGESQELDVRSYDMDTRVSGAADKFDQEYVLAALGSSNSCADVNASGGVSALDVSALSSHIGHHVERRLIAPNGGESFARGETMHLQWTPGLGESSYVRLLLGNPDRWIAMNLRDQGTYDWVIPSDVPIGESYSVFLVHMAGCWNCSPTFVGEDASDGTFSINPAEGGCPFVDVLKDTGWSVENSILGRSISNTLTTDTYRLKGMPAVGEGRYRLRIRENEMETTTLDRVSLISVDHPIGTRVYALKDRFVLAQREAPYRAVSSTGRDVTHLVNGSGSGFFIGEQGDVLDIDLIEPGKVVAPVPADLDPFEMDDGDKGGGGGGLSTGDLDATGAALDAQILSSTGILIQGKNALGEWETVRRRYPREHFDSALIDTLDEGPVRLVFVGRHKLRYVGRVVPTSLVPPQVHRLARARHDRLGNVQGLVSAGDDQTITLVTGDTLDLEFVATPVPEGQVRDFFLVSRGVYTSQPLSPERQTVELPQRFELLQNRPNPFARSTLIGFELPRAERVRIEIFDAQGRLVKTAADQHYQPGRWSVEWDGRDEAGSLMPATLYFYRMTAGGFRTQKKLVMLP